MVGAVASMCLCQCETQRTEGKTRSSSYSFDQKVWGSQAGGESEDTAKIREKFVNHGFTVDKDGNFQAKHNNLYGDSTAREADSKFKTKELKFKTMKASTKVFKTPEYLKMQDFKGVKSAQEQGKLAREANFGKSRWRDSGKLFRNKSKEATRYASYETGQYQKAGKKFATRENKAIANAYNTSPKPTLKTPAGRYEANANLSMDDVKKMLNPNDYARGTGLIE